MVSSKNMAKEMSRYFKNLNVKESKEIIDWLFNHMEEEVYNAKKVSVGNMFNVYIDIAKPRKVTESIFGFDKLPYRWTMKVKPKRIFSEKIRSKPVYIEEN